MPIQKNTELHYRFLHRADAGARVLTAAEINELNNSLDPIEDLGLQTRDGDILGLDAKVPSIFLTVPNPDYSDTVKTLSEANITYGSPEFWRQVQLGNVFVYPAGQHKPSQLQLSAKGNEKPVISLSRPVENENKMPQRPLRKPNFFHRVFSFMVPSFKEIVQSWDNRGRSNIDLSVKSHLNNRTEGAAKDELKDLERLKKSLADKANEQKIYDENKHLLEAVDKEYETVDLRMDNMYRVYGVKPSARANMIGESQYATKENFNKLKDYSKELDMYSIKNGKHMFTDEDFATIAYYTAYKDEHMKRTLTKRASYDPEYIEKLQNSGLSKQDAEFIGNRWSSMYATTDFFELDEARGNDGNITIEGTVQPAREDTKVAFLSYKDGNKDPLAKLVANAVKHASFETNAIEEVKNLNKFAPYPACKLEQAGRLAEILEKDPKLAEIAMKKYGMREDDLKLVQGLGQYKKIVDARKEAKKALADAAVRGREIPEETKKKYIRDIAKADLIEQMYVNETKNRVNSDKVNELSAGIQANIDMNMRKGAKPAPGKFAPNHAISVTMYDLPAMYNERSKFICGLKADSPALNAAVDKMVLADNLYQPGKNPADTLTSVQKGFSPNAMQEGAKEMLRQAQPKQNQPQNLLNGQPAAGQNNIINGMPDGPIM